MTEAHQPLAPRDLLILATLAEAPSHGYGLIKRVKERSGSGISLDPANLYRVLRRMRRASWIGEVAAGGDAHPQQDPVTAPARRRTYQITETGRTVLIAEVSRLEQLLQQARPALANGGER